MNVTEHYPTLPGNVTHERYPLPPLWGNSNGNPPGKAENGETLPVWLRMARQAAIPPATLRTLVNRAITVHVVDTALASVVTAKESEREILTRMMHSHDAGGWN